MIRVDFRGFGFGSPDANELKHRRRRQTLTWKAQYWTLGFDLQMSFKTKAKAAQSRSTPAKNLHELKRGESGILDRLEVPEDEARRLMEMGFLPGHKVTPAHSAPGGDPRVFRVDGSEVALRRETAIRLILR
jgi:ferrous iron transport protein A